MKKIYVFDFDGTLTSSDTLLSFIRYACGPWRFFLGFLLFSPLLVLMKLGLYSNYRVKQRVFSWYFRGMTKDDFDRTCRKFAHDKDFLMRPKAFEKLIDLFSTGENICVVSASIDNWVRPFFDFFSRYSNSDFHVLCTQIEVDANGIITGRFLTNNCYGQEKVERLCQEFPMLREHREIFHIEAYGDSRGDKELLAFADEAHYKPFR